MVKTEYFGEFTIEMWEYLLLPFYLFVILLISIRTRNKNIASQPNYKYYIPGLFAKLGGSVLFCMIYIYYYKGGDTTAYYESAIAFANLFQKNYVTFFEVLFGENSLEHLTLFDKDTGAPLSYMYYDTQTLMVIRVISPLMLLSFKSYLLCTILLSWLSYFGIWRLFLLFSDYYKPLTRQFAIAVLFIPSVIFWGSGILKDTITLSATCWFVYGVYRVFVKKKNRLTYTIVFLLAAYFIVSIKPYIFITLLPGTLFWIFYERLLKIKNKAMLALYMPMIYLVSIVGGAFILSKLGSSMSKFSLDKVLMTAAVTQQDLKQGYYSSNYFDIGEFDPSVSGILSKAPVAITAGLFRPFLWDSGNVVMLFSALENTFILGITVLLLLRIKIGRMFKIIFRNPLLLFALSYSILFSFSVGLTTSNFGALVRFKIPFLPFFVCSLFILSYFMKNKKLLTVETEQPKPRARSLVAVTD
jgi:hypothetical protein